MNDLLDHAIDAVRAAGDDFDAGVPQATGLRVRRSVEARARRPRIWAAIAAALGIGLGGSVAFAIASGRWTLGSKPQPPATASSAPVAAAPAPHARGVERTMAPITTPMPIEQPEPPTPAPAPPRAPAEMPTHTPAPPTPPRTPAPRTAAISPAAAPRAEVEAAYKRAHELHFRGDDPLAALAAWDDYLRADPSGRFAAEARFNRAIDLIKLGRYDDARVALAPFARGDVAPAGYHRDDAKALLDRLDAIGAPDSTIVAAPGTTP